MPSMSSLSCNRTGQSEYRTAKALIQVAENNLNLAQLNLHRSEVVAPANGTLSNFELKEGTMSKLAKQLPHY